MAKKKAAVKKTVTKKAKPANKQRLDDGIYWVVLERKILSAQAKSLHETRAEAQTEADRLDKTSSYSFNRYVVQRVELSQEG